jgi:hypothetical protein
LDAANRDALNWAYNTIESCRYIGSKLPLNGYLNAQIALCILRRFEILKGDDALLVQVPSGCKVKMEKIVMGKALFQRVMPREILGVDLLNSIQPIPPSNCFSLLLLG